MTRIGVFGSAFNPPHFGHRVLVAEARWQLRLDRLIVVPTGDPYHKAPDHLPDGKTRLALAEAAFAGDPGVEVSDLEVRRAGPSYSCDTLEAITASNRDSELVLLMGSDAALGLGSWHRPGRVTGLARIAVVTREGTDRAAVEAAVTAAGGTKTRFVEMPQIAISSTLIRERARTGTPYRHLVPAAVAGMIQNERLYAG